MESSVHRVSWKFSKEAENGGRVGQISHASKHGVLPAAF